MANRDEFIGGQHSCAIGNCAYCYKRQLTEACEVIEALLEKWTPINCDCGQSPCAVGERADAFMARVKSSRT